MKKMILFIAILALIAINMQACEITSIFFDIETIFQTDSMRASGYIGKFDSLRYLSSKGNLPCQEDLFQQLKPIKAISTKTTYNKSLEMPLILSDWLTMLQPSNKINDIIAKHLNERSISDTEKKVLLAIVSMMLTAKNLALTQKVSSKMISMLEELKHSNYNLYLVGNWAQISTLRSEFSSLFRLFTGVYTSGELHLLKPQTEFYQKVLNLSGRQTNKTVWIETEPKFISIAQQLGLNVISYNNNCIDDITKGLHKFGIWI